MPTIGVLITCYNAADTIVHPLQSLASQSTPADTIVVVDDGSTDDTVRVVEEAVTKLGLDHVTTIRAGRVGRGRALNIALMECKCSHAIVLDADDILHPSAVAVFKREVLRFPKSAALSPKAILWTTDIPKWPSVPERLEWRALDKYDLAWRNPICHSGTLLAFEAIRELGGYRESLPSQLDYDLWVRMVAAGYDLRVTQTCLTGKRIHSHQKFEGSNRLVYCLASLSRHREAIRLLNLGAGWHCVPFAKFAYSLVVGTALRKIRTRESSRGSAHIQE